MASITLQVNGKVFSVDVDPATPLLWVLRDGLGLMGTKYSWAMSWDLLRGRPVAMED
jgi:isoquinoline 1-oxidoreductase alpha subunit